MTQFQANRVFNRLIDRLELSRDKQNALKSIYHEIETHTQGLYQAQEQYKDFIKRLYDIKKPFSWNKKNPNTTKDFEHFLNLIDHCIYAGDETLLDEFGIKPLTPPNNVKLAQEVNYYTNEFKSILTNPEEELTEKQKYYIKYLIQCLERLPNHS